MATALSSPSTVVNFNGYFSMPLSVDTLDGFLNWAHDDAFPEQGRIDFLNGRIEVNMSPEEILSHGSPKDEIHRVLSNRCKSEQLGRAFVDGVRFTLRSASASAEPDIICILNESLATDKISFVASPKCKGRYIELEGAADLIVEIVSDSSVKKDTRDLPAAYFKEAVREYWLVDARGEELSFLIQRRGQNAFEPVEADDSGAQWSEVMRCHYRLERSDDQFGYWQYDLVESA